MPKAKTFTGFDSVRLDDFFKQAASIASATKRVDSTADGFALKQKTIREKQQRDGGGNPMSTQQVSTKQGQRDFSSSSAALTDKFTTDQIKGFVDAFSLRQDEVFGRRAQPGMSQTRLV